MIQKGTYRQKSVKRLAPDAFVLIMENNYIQSPVAGSPRVYFNEDIENISINGSVDAPIASASFTVNVPRKDRDKYFINGASIFEVMMEVRIFIKGRYNIINDTGLSPPQPYQQFWGMITDVSDEYNAGSHKITVSCKDMLYWLQISKMNLRPAVLTAQNTGASLQPRAGILGTQSPKEIITKLINYAYGGQKDKNINGAFWFDTLSDARSITGYKNNNTLSEDKLSRIPQDVFISDQVNFYSNYWAAKFGILDNFNADTGAKDAQGNPKPFVTLLVYGFSGLLDQKATPSPNTLPNPKSAGVSLQSTQAIPGITEGPQDESSSVSDFGSMNIAQAAVTSSTQSGPVVGTAQSQYFDQIIAKAAPYGQITNIDVMHSEYQTFLDICINCRDYIGYEFYMSLDGDIVFKPPLFNLDVKTYRPFVVKDTDIVSYNFTESDDVVTIYSIRGNLSQEQGTQAGIQATGTAYDARLAIKYGLRVQTTDSQMSAAVGTVKPVYKQAEILALFAQNEMDRHNAKRFSGQITLVGVPEIKLGYPIYIEPFDMYAYVTGINHSFNFGSSFQTTVTLTAFRKASVLGKDMVMVPGETGNTSLNPTANPKLYDNGEAKQVIAGTRLQADRVRVFAQASSTNLDPDNAIQSLAQRVTDLDGYDVIGVLPYGANLVLDTRGNVSQKVSALNFNTSVFTGDSIIANKVAGINIQAANKGDATVVPSTSSAPSQGGEASKVASVAPQGGGS